MVVTVRRLVAVVAIDVFLPELLTARISLWWEAGMSGGLIVTHRLAVITFLPVALTALLRPRLALWLGIPIALGFLGRALNLATTGWNLHGGEIIYMIGFVLDAVAVSGLLAIWWRRRRATSPAE
jgi:hypothetical protein